MLPRILVVDDDHYTRTLFQRLLGKSAELSLAADGGEARRLFAAGDFNLVQWAAGATMTLVGLSVLKLGVLAMFLAPIAAGLASVLHGFGYAARRVTLRPSLHWSKEIVRSGLPAIHHAQHRRQLT